MPTHQNCQWDQVALSVWFGVLGGSHVNFGTREVQCRDRETLFGQASFEIPLFGIAQLGLEQTLIAINIAQMRTQTDNSLFHDTLSCIKNQLVVQRFDYENTRII
jgi:hypothetical protein